MWPFEWPLTWEGVRCRGAVPPPVRFIIQHPGQTTEWWREVVIWSGRSLTSVNVLNLRKLSEDISVEKLKELILQHLNVLGHSIIKCEVSSWQHYLKAFNTQGLQERHVGGGLQALRFPRRRCNYISVSIRSRTVRCRELHTSLSGAKLAFGCVMSEMLDSSSAGMLQRLSLLPSTCQLRIAAVVSDEASHPAEHQPKPVLPPLAACHLRTPHPITSSPAVSLFHISSSFSWAVHESEILLIEAERASRWPTCAGLWLAAADQDSSSLLLFLLLHPSCRLDSILLFSLAVRLSSRRAARPNVTASVQRLRSDSAWTFNEVMLPGSAGGRR